MRQYPKLLPKLRKTFYALLYRGYLSSAASYLSDDFTEAEFQLEKVISGVEEQQPRWKRAVSVPNGILGEALANFM